MSAYCFTLFGYYLTRLAAISYYFTISLRMQYWRGRFFGVGSPRRRTTFASLAATLRCRPPTMFQVLHHVPPRLSRTTRYYNKQTSGSQPQTTEASQPQTSATEFFASRADNPACRPAFLHVGRTYRLGFKVFGLRAANKCRCPGATPNSSPA